MKKFIVVTFSFLLLQLSSYACGGPNQQVYTGDIRYSFSPSNPYKCDIIVTLNFDIPDNLSTDSIWIEWGDGNASVIWATSIVQDTNAKVNQGIDLYKHVYSGYHIYDSVSADGYYFISMISQYRLNSINNIASGSASNLPLYLAAQVSIDTSIGFTDQSPMMKPALVPFAGVNTSFYQNPGAYDTDGDSLAFEVVTPLEYLNAPVPLYVMPDFYCQEYGQTNSNFILNAHTGEINWNIPCQIGVYAVVVRTSQFRNGKLLGSTMREQNIYVTTNAVAGVSEVAANAEIEIYPNPAANRLSGTISNNISEKVAVQILSIDGAIAINNISAKNGRFDADISVLPSGLYFLHIYDGEHNYSRKFIKQ